MHTIICVVCVALVVLALPTCVSSQQFLSARIYLEAKCVEKSLYTVTLDAVGVCINIVENRKQLRNYSYIFTVSDANPNKVIHESFNGPNCQGERDGPVQKYTLNTCIRFPTNPHFKSHDFLLHDGPITTENLPAVIPRNTIVEVVYSNGCNGTALNVYWDVAWGRCFEAYGHWGYKSCMEDNYVNYICGSPMCFDHSLCHMGSTITKIQCTCAYDNYATPVCADNLKLPPVVN